MSPAVKQGIAVAIMGCDGARTSLRRTLSADMSSKQWLAQNGFGLSSPPLIKKTASSKDLFLNPIADSFSDDEEEKQVSLPNFDIWTSIVSPAERESLPPPYVHPLVKRSATSLSQNSLQICTESLGSETGSDGFSSDADSESDRKPAASMALAPSPAAVRSFPPPLPSLSCRGAGDCAPALRMRSRRENGRLVVEAVAVPATPPNFSAQRLDGRLVLKLARSIDTVTSDTFEEAGELEEQFEDYDSEEEEKDEERFVPRKNDVIAESRLINFHRLALMANKPLGTFLNRNIKEDEDQKPAATVAKSLPPRVPVSRMIPAPASAKVSTTAAASLNHYDYFWRAKIGSQNDGVKSEAAASNDRKESVVDGYHLVHLLKGCCNEPRRTLIWHPRCIATS